MPFATPARSPTADPGRLALDRVRFLTAEPVAPGGVREAILASWWRTRGQDVPADRIEVPFVSDLDLDVPLVRSADPVLRHLADQMAGQSVSIVLTDSVGTVLRRLTGDSELDRHLDRVRLAPGFSYAERHAGTNGIGTALEGGGPMHVFGHEHYAENLEDLACAAVPIHHPVTGKTVGALDLTCWYRDAGPLLGTLAATTAEQIRQALLADTGIREIELLQEYLRTCRRSGGIVFALNRDVAMMNDYGRTLLDPADQAAVLREAGSLVPSRGHAVELDLPSGARARLHGRAVQVGGRHAGVVVQVRLLEHASDTGAATEPGTAARMLLPGLVGADPVWRRACDEVERVRASGDWLAVEGEPGVGKLAVLRALHQRHAPNRRLTVLDATSAGKGWLDELTTALDDGGASIVIRHVDGARPALLRSVRHALQDAAGRDHRPWVAVTVGSRPAVTAGAALPVTSDSAELGRVLQMFPRSVEVPALRHHAEDLRRLVPFLLGRLGCGGRLTCSPETMIVLMRSTWPGNVNEVLAVLRSIVQHRRTGVVQPGDLPPGIRTVSRRLLSPLESLERDAIVRSLLDAGGSKGDAARALGISRATMYRRIREYGIVVPDA